MRVTVSGRSLRSPAECACCMGHGDSVLEVAFTKTSGKKVVREHTKSWPMPYCEACLDHVRAWQRAASTFGTMLMLVLVGGVVAGFTASWPVGLGIAVGGGALTIVWGLSLFRGAENMRSEGCVSAAAAVKYVGWNGSVHAFEMQSELFGERFMEVNASKVVLASDGLDHVVKAMPMKRESQAAERDARPRRASAKASSAQTWIEKIESLKGEVSRRGALQQGLAELFGEERDKLISAAAEIEANAAIDKADALKTESGRARALESAIAKLENDDLPDELQAAALQRLRAELKALRGTP